MYANHLRDTKIFKGIAWNSMTRNYSRSNENHYDVLNLKKDCTDKEIRESFVKLSKEHHPDTNASIKDGSQFAKVMEAYKVLGKTASRQAYDDSLKFNYVEHNGQIFRPHKHGFHEPQTDHDWTRGGRRFSNKYVVYFCLIGVSIGVIAQYFAIRYAAAYQRKKVDEKSAKISAQYRAIKAEAEKYGTKVQLERLLPKID
ncbi:dnaJ-like protein 60 [Culicoides brevitarsis]|uniref:dnaJ-like protein 60 n=1 Tax=Culicoides brevitarsis TaxID=469753 RepID=UPI00307C0DBD